MHLRRVLLLALIFCFAAPSAFAQEDEFLTPLAPAPAAKSKGKVVKQRKPAKGKKPAKGAEEEPLESEFLTPLVKKTELLVKFSGVARGTRLFVDDKELGPVSRTPVELEPGEHSIVVRKMGYRDFSRRVTLKPGELTEVAVSLDATAGFVSVKADVAGARVLVNGEDKGQAPLDSLMLPAGSYEITVEREGFRPETKRIAVRAGKDYSVEVNLRPEAIAQTDQPRAPILTPSETSSSPLKPLPTEVSTSKPLTSRWYFWAGVGAVVAAAAVGAVVATSQPLGVNDVCPSGCDAVINPPGASSVGRVAF
ncbi:PEGA domain-containing protein [Melittangium boletus]|uniref:PEGA domain-containing protein n=1 Tax=Melittangium boletus DSM 14713 TaxID=1294270 RepID=A0A250I7T9_9BACT|nr:PEGA domain-containing protein [Melittangium boletus]ATB27939.1 PEGA domain-containing protein [Melittangium boletus DSM 14713]